MERRTSRECCFSGERVIGEVTFEGDEIKNLQGAEESTAKTKIFHAGTASGENGAILANGGRVLGITAMGSSVKNATKNAYEAIDKIDWASGFCRRDIAYRAIKRENGGK